MDDERDAYQRRRESLLTIFLAIVGGLAVLCFLILITLGYILWVIPGVLAVAALGTFHYLLWGRTLNRNVAGEREEAELQAKLEANDWDLPEPRRPRHY